MRSSSVLAGVVPAATLIAALWVGVAPNVYAEDPSSVGVVSDLERTASTSPQEKIAYAETSNQEIRDAEKQISKLLDQARKDGDDEAIECLMNRLTSVRALLSVSEASEIAMKDALAAGLEEKADHEFRKIAVAISKTRMLLAESERCASDQTVESGTTLVDWESALSDESDLPTDVITDWDVGLDPPEVTPFL